jgi:tRNA pseudouridine38-40 synthase
MLKNYQLIISYDGSSFFGWQIQNDVRTIQGEIEKELKSIFKVDNINLIGSGRTDSGVHANGQVANFKIKTNMSEEQIKNAINRKLSKDIFIKDCKIMKDDFNSRFAAINREYIYYIIEDYSPINRMYSWHCKWPINKDRLDECADLLIGKNDYTLFSKASSETKNKICKISYSKWDFNDSQYSYKIIGNRFLQHMVRLLVGTMIEVGRERLTIENFKNILNCKEDKVTAVRAPASGLFLNKIYYE